jgi:hypothetical protein
MPVSYSTADQDVLDRLADVMREFHRPLFDAGVRVGVLVAVSDGDAPAVVGHGYPALATIKVVSLKDRVTKGIDAELLLDLREYERLTAGQQAALLDHELSHIALKECSYLPVLDARGQPTGETQIAGVERDDLDRPKLRAVKGDVSAGDGFRQVIRRHRESAIEFINAARFRQFAEAAARGDD